MAAAHGGALERVDRPGWSVCFEATMADRGSDRLDLASSAPAR